MHRGDGEPYNPYPEEEPRREHHHHLFGHHHSEEEPQYGSNLEHRPPPPREDSGDSAAHGYGEGPYGQERRPVPYEEQQHGGYDAGKHSSQYPPGPNPYGPPAPGQMVASLSSSFRKVVNRNVIMLMNTYHSPFASGCVL